MSPYIPGEQPRGGQYIKLNTNELPFPPSPKAIEAINREVLRDMRLYPDPEVSVLIKAAADFYGVAPSMVYAGNGSDEVLAFAFMAFLERRRLFAPDISYGFYPVYARLFDADYQEMPLREDLSLSVDDYMKVHGNIVIANPNAPTGLAVPVEDIEKLAAARQDRLVIIDEAYGDFWGQSCVPLTEKYDNLLVVQTLSKSRALAGMRVGLAVGSPALIEDLNRVKFSFHPYNINRLSLIAAAEALEDRKYFEKTTAKIISLREGLKSALRERGFSLTDSQSNFVFAKSCKTGGGELYLKLKEKRVLVRRFDLPRIRDYLRITVGSEGEIAALLSALDELRA
jgi:histidinol-phosphate aminotransferase